jgi:hypothetical protein
LVKQAAIVSIEGEQHPGLPNGALEHDFVRKPDDPSTTATMSWRAVERIRTLGSGKFSSARNFTWRRA